MGSGQPSSVQLFGIGISRPLLLVPQGGANLIQASRGDLSNSHNFSRPLVVVRSSMIIGATGRCRLCCPSTAMPSKPCARIACVKRAPPPKISTEIALDAFAALVAPASKHRPVAAFKLRPFVRPRSRPGLSVNPPWSLSAASSRSWPLSRSMLARSDL